jgi:disulfide bond formation protein DsbB
MRCTLSQRVRRALELRMTRDAPLLRLLQPSAAIVLATVGSALLLAGAWWFQLVLGLLPCKLCLEQRWPHYAALFVGGVALALGLAGIGGQRLARGALWLLALLFTVSIAMGAYHAGVEWGFFMGPSDCGGAGPAVAGSMQDFMRQLQTTRVVSCTEAAWRWLGLSLAGWNAVFSAVLASLAAIAAIAAGQRGPQGSSSLSQ